MKIIYLFFLKENIIYLLNPLRKKDQSKCFVFMTGRVKEQNGVLLI
ncbi:hypothetical protein MtrunA17_Chr4g0058361 [Medicago truncatula]|uniref:Uncharacterized protein n=1 Tax=Medicago truncatula TaxID=3880 RepID=A0A396ICZ6_MEDTR|nr:hypothetical protein MtrunA17_Chr4g0058361 [Medicago truncatula]